MSNGGIAVVLFLFLSSAKSDQNDTWYAGLEELEEILSNFKYLSYSVTTLCKALDPDFKLKFPREKACPDGFQYVDRAGSCYKVIYETLVWENSAAKCRELNSRAHLATVTTAQEMEALREFLPLELKNNSKGSVCRSGGVDRVWTSGNRALNSCSDPWFWKESSTTSIAFGYTNWNPGEPNCGEDCVLIAPNWNGVWSDVPCNWSLCGLCEYDP